ncbi:hypothetical protein SALBM135S_09900 [Streptomyces alboniger]
MTGAASIAVMDVVAVTRVAARPAALPVPKRSAAAAVSAGFSTAVLAPTSRQNTANRAKPPAAPSAADTPSTARAPAAARTSGTRSMNGARAVPTSRAARPPSPRRPPIAATPLPASSAMGTR